MNLEHGLRLELNQKLMMTPELRQAIAVLQLSAMDLSEVISQEVLENPVLEIGDKGSSDSADSTGGETAEQPEGPEEFKDNERLEDYLSWDDYFNDGMEKRSEYTPTEEKRTFEVFVKNNISLQEHLEEQLCLAAPEAVLQRVADYLIGCIDDNGYLEISIADAAQLLAVSAEMVEDAIELIQSFEPMGVGAATLEECLLLQLLYKGIDDEVAEQIIHEYLPAVGEGRYKFIADKLGCSVQRVQRAVDVIRTLDPKPGRAFGKQQAMYVTPDITVERVNGKYVIIVNDSNIPSLTINPYYRQVASQGDQESRKFIEERLNSAVWLIKSIEQRRRTLYNVMEAIVELQQEFFDYGPKYLRPLVMRQVAEQIAVHESTVSRAIANKYADTPHGLVSLRSFFTAAVRNSVGGQDVSASKVKGKIKELITGENPSEPLSDQVLADMLSGHGIKVSRRTVTKYREELGIISSTKRKRY